MSRYLSIRAASGAVALVLAFACFDAASAEDAATPSAVAVDQLPPGQDVSPTVIELAGWVVATGDSEG